MTQEIIDEIPRLILYHNLFQKLCIYFVNTMLARARTGQSLVVTMSRADRKIN